MKFSALAIGIVTLVLVLLWNYQAPDKMAPNESDTQSTSGGNSPVIHSGSGDVTITYTYPNEVDQKINELQEANIVFNSPSSAQKNKVVPISLILSASENIEKLLQKLTGAEKESAVVKFSKRMKAELIGENKNAFEIVQITPTVQAVSSMQSTQWKWDVTPVESGRQYLHLTLTALITVDEKETEWSVKTFDKEIQVNVVIKDEIRNFVSENWKWVLGSLIFPLIVWYWKRRHSKKPDKNG